MNKWLLRLVGVLILGVLAILFYDLWFRPSVPDVLQDEITLEVDNQTQTPTDEVDNASQDGDVDIPPAPPIQLTSLEDQNEPAVLSNPDVQPTPTQTTETVDSSESAPEPTAPPAQTDTTSGAAWVQVGSFADDENAQQMVSQMQARQWPTDTEVANVNGKSYHRVFVGPLSASDVPDYLAILNEMGINAREVTR